MIRRFITGFLTLVLLVLGSIAAPMTVSAATQGTACGWGDAEHVRVWENITSETTNGNDSLWLCASSYPNLATDPDWSISGTCQRDGADTSSWNDCVSSITLVVPQNRRLCLYRDKNYENLLVSFPGPWIGQRRDLTDYAGANDNLSSLKFVTGNQAACNN